MWLLYQILGCLNTPQGKAARQGRGENWRVFCCHRRGLNTPQGKAARQAAKPGGAPTQTLSRLNTPQGKAARQAPSRRCRCGWLRAVLIPLKVKPRGKYGCQSDSSAVHLSSLNTPQGKAARQEMDAQEVREMTPVPFLQKVSSKILKIKILAGKRPFFRFSSAARISKPPSVDIRSSYYACRSGS